MASTLLRKPAPAIETEALLPNGQFTHFSLAAHKGKYVVLFFYPLDFTFVCPTELVAFSDRMADFKAIDCEVVGCSIDSKFTHLAWTSTPRNKGGVGKLEYPLLADVSHQIARDYGVEINVDGDGDNGIAYRGLFIIDPKGIVRQITVNDLPVGRSVDEVLRLVQAFQYVDKHGEVCPANWKPGAKTMKADPVGSQEYFSSLDEKMTEGQHQDEGKEDNAAAGGHKRKQTPASSSKKRAK